MARKAKKRYARATVNGVDHVFEFDVEELDSQKLELRSDLVYELS